MKWIRYSCVCLLLLINAWEDWRKMEICMWSLGVFALLGAVLQAIFAWNSPLGILSGMIVGGMMVFLSWLSGGEIGAGDGLLLGVTGIYLGLMKNLELLLCALLLCAMVTAGLWMCGNVHRKNSVPFVPFLFVACLGCMAGW